MTVIEHERVAKPERTIEQEVLTRAADLLEEFGWCQNRLAKDADGTLVGHLESSAASFCLVGAIDRARADLGLSHRFDHVPRLRERFPRQRIPEGLIVPESAWNDEPGRTREEVVALLRELAA